MTVKEKAVVVEDRSNPKEVLAEKKRKSRRLVKAHLKEKENQEKEGNKFDDNRNKSKQQLIDPTDFLNEDIESIKSYDMLCSIFEGSLVYSQLSRMDKILIKETFASDGAT